MYLLILSEIKISKGVSVTLPLKVLTDYQKHFTTWCPSKRRLKERVSLH